MFTTVRSVTHPFVMVQVLKFNIHSNFQVSTTELLTIANMLYITSLELRTLKLEVYTLGISPFLPSLNPWQPPNSCFSEFHVKHTSLILNI